MGKGQQQSSNTAKALKEMWATRKVEISAKISAGQRQFWGPLRKVNPRDFHEYVTWREEVYLRDSNTCQKCGKAGLAGKQRHAHHIKGWDENPELRFNVSNGQTLCSSCHYLEAVDVRIQALKESKKRTGSSIAGYFWITNGLVTSMLPKGTPLPLGFSLGRLLKPKVIIIKPRPVNGTGQLTPPV